MTQDPLQPDLKRTSSVPICVGDSRTRSPLSIQY